MTKSEHNSLVKRIARYESDERLQHTLRVEALAVELARFWHVPEDQARMAALLHDVAKDMPHDQLIRIACKSEDPLVRDMSSTPASVVLHAPVGSLIARDEFGVTDARILCAIAFHTTGDPSMDDLSKITFLADYCEEGQHFDGVKEVRRLLYQDLDRAMAVALRQILAYVAQHGWPLDERTARAEQAFSREALQARQP